MWAALRSEVGEAEGGPSCEFTAHPHHQDAPVPPESDLGCETRFQTYRELLSMPSPLLCLGEFFFLTF